jgi:hypothetical protein
MRDIPSIRAQNLKAAEPGYVQGKAHKDCAFAILSAEREDRTFLENIQATNRMRDRLLQSGLPYRATRGSYQGTREDGFCVAFPEGLDSGLDFVMKLAGAYQQDSVLVVDEEGTASLYFTGGGIRVLGKWRQRNLHLINLHKDDYTTDGDRYWIVEPVAAEAAA